MAVSLNSTRRFSSRVENYIKYRPGYPDAVIELFRNECGLAPASIVADVGSGTGILTDLFLRNGCTVFGVEPNEEMRKAAERLLNKYPNFTNISGTAESTSLPDRSVDIITAGQAFHWFNRDETRQEFFRILKHRGWVGLIWNDRDLIDPFSKAYEQLLETYGIDYEKVNHRLVDAGALGSFFGKAGFRQAVFPNEQFFNLEGLTGRLLSSSYAPEAEHPDHAPMLKALDTIFHEHQRNGEVRIAYKTKVYYGELSG